MADTSYFEVDFLRRRAHTLRLGLHQRLDEVYVYDFPGGSPKILIQLLQKILAEISIKIDAADDPAFLTLVCQAIQINGSLLEFLDNANTEQTPRGLVRILEDLIKKLEPNTELLAWPQSEYNYSIRHILNDLKNIIINLFTTDEFNNIFSEFSDDLKLISFPRIERDNILVHAVFGHEIGHPIADKFILEEEKTAEYREELISAVEAISTKYSGRLEGRNENSKFIEMQNLLSLLINIRKRGLEELISDCVAIYLFGPSALFAGIDIFMPSGLDYPPKLPELYPPSRMRLRISKQLMDNEGYTGNLFKVIEKNKDSDVSLNLKLFLDYVEDLTTQSHDQDIIKEQLIIRIAYDWLMRSFDKAIDFAKKEIIDILYDPNTILKEVPELLERLQLGLPPNEIDKFPNVKPADWRSSILSAWIYKINGIKEKSTSDQTLDIDHLNKLTLQAVEYSILQKEYNNSLSLE